MNPDPMVKVKSSPKEEAPEPSSTDAKPTAASIEIKALAHSTSHVVNVGAPAKTKKAEDTLAPEEPAVEEVVPETAKGVDDSPAPADDAVAEDTTEVKSEDKEPEEDSKPDAKQEEPDTATSAEDAELVDELANQATAKTDKARDEKATAERREKVEKLVANKTYFLPIGQVGRKRSRRLMWVLLLLLLIIAAAVYLAIDAKLLPIHVTLPYEFVK